ncbi:aldo/keto reductase [Stenotrophomonas sp. SMYL82]|uniref:aldo/keto reductase n=1 Tax=Stenotrophomonas sp. SMYL82 TaxID=3076048 RepID=UPI002E784E28|nr:aldo/keto reductase [Stenotrophomonas sp. SMYL82]
MSNSSGMLCPEGAGDSCRADAPEAFEAAHPGASAKLAFGATRIAQGQEGVRFLSQLYAAGCRDIDVARSYQDGEAERTIGAWLSSSRMDEGPVRIITKGGHPDADGNRLEEPHLRADAVASLSALQVDALDVFLLHRDDQELPVASIADSLHGLWKSGMVKAYGVSNWSFDRVQELSLALADLSAPALSVSSPQCSPGRWRSMPWPGCHSIAGQSALAERGAYARTPMELLLWSPLGGGFFTAKSAELVLAGTLKGDSSYDTAENRELLLRLREVARSREVSVEAVSLATCRAQVAHATTVISTSDVHRYRSLWRSKDLSLGADELNYIWSRNEH